MSQWDTVRAIAREQRRSLAADGAVPTALLIDRAAAATGIAYALLPSDHALLYGAQGVYDPEYRMIWVDASLPTETRNFVLAHEYAHHWLGHGAVISTAADIDPTAAEDPGGAGAQRVDGYTPFDLVERSANVFAREFLAPPELLIPWFDDRQWGNVVLRDVPALGRYLGVPERMLYYQLSRALLLPLSSASVSPAAISTPDAVPLDGSQRAAAYAERGPMLVEAGPGTGKTRTLVHRVTYLLETGAAPEEILALTFSNRAAGELRDRVALAQPDAAPRLWAGTFHAFALELLRKYADGRIDALKPGFEIIDPVDARIQFESVVTGLELSHYEDLTDPTAPFPAFFSAFSRAKDELIGPDAYAALVVAMDDGDDRSRAAEVARAYACYQSLLREMNVCDFGDLLLHAVTLLRDWPEVQQAVRAQYRHILVDEYQDVNRASRELLRRIAGEGAGLWVVGDARQAIYGFRGASYGSLRDFPSDYPGASVVRLTRNYRSCRAIVEKVSALAPHIGTQPVGPFAPWEVHRTDAEGTFEYVLCATEAEEAETLAAAMQQLRAAGVPYRDQAMLCRSYTVLERIAARLEALGVPVLYLGDLFERPEVRDLLSLLSLASDPDGRGLARVAQFAAYQVPPGDVRRLLSQARSAGETFPAALRLVKTLPDLTDAGRVALIRLTSDIRAAFGSWTAPYTMLARYLFDESAYLSPILADASLAGQQRRLALYQFLDFVHSYQRREELRGGDALRGLFRYVRSIEIAREDRRYGQLPAWADEIDAVRLLIVHAAKGLEFPVVFIPQARHGHFPAKGPTPRFTCPPPPGMIAGDAGLTPSEVKAREKERDEEEEDCLAFVALSRARDRLILTCSAYATARLTKTRPPPWLGHLVPQLPPVPPKPAAAAVAPVVPTSTASSAPHVFSAVLLDAYARCPRRYAYDYVWGFREHREQSAYNLFVRCVYAVLGQIADEQLSGAQAIDRFATEWRANGPPDEHPYAALYQRRGRAMIERAAATLAGLTADGATVRRSPQTLDLGDGFAATVTPDALLISPDRRTVRAQRWLTGGPREHHKEDKVFGLLYLAAKQEVPDVEPTIEIRYVARDHEAVPVFTKGKTGEPTPPSATVIANRRSYYRKAAEGIVAGRFDPKPTDFGCPRCPYYFICPGRVSAVADEADESAE